VVLDRLDIEKRRADLRPIAQPADNLDAEMHAVPTEDDRCRGSARAWPLSIKSSASAPDWGDEGKPIAPRPRRRAAGRAEKWRRNRQAGSRWMGRRNSAGDQERALGASTQQRLLRATPTGPALGSRRAGSGDGRCRGRRIRGRRRDGSGRMTITARSTADRWRRSRSPFGTEYCAALGLTARPVRHSRPDATACMMAPPRMWLARRRRHGRCCGARRTARRRVESSWRAVAAQAETRTRGGPDRTSHPGAPTSLGPGFRCAACCPA